MCQASPCLRSQTRPWTSPPWACFERCNLLLVGLVLVWVHRLLDRSINLELRQAPLPAICASTSNVAPIWSKHLLRNCSWSVSVTPMQPRSATMRRSNQQNTHTCVTTVIARTLFCSTLSQNSPMSLPHQGWLNFWLTVLTGISGPGLVFGFHSSHVVMCVLIHWSAYDLRALHRLSSRCRRAPGGDHLSHHVRIACLGTVEEFFSARCQAQRNCAGFTTTTLRKKVSGGSKSRKIREMKRKEMKWMGTSKRSLNMRMKHDDDHGVNKDSNLSRLEPQCACIFQGRQSKDNDSNWQQRETRKMKGLQCVKRFMHWHQLWSHVPQVFQVTSHIVAFRSVLRVVNPIAVAVPHLFNFWFVREFTQRKRVFEVVFTHTVSCSRPPSSEVFFFFSKTAVLSCRFACMHDLSTLNFFHELQKEPVHCHQLEEKTPWLVHCWYFQYGMGLSCRPPDSWCRRFDVDNASLKSERFLNGPPVFPDLLREIHQFCLYRKYFCLRHFMVEILVLKLVHFGTDFFISIMFEVGCTKFGIDQKAIVDPLKTTLDAFFFKLWAWLYFLLRSFPMSVAMGRPFLIT